VEVPFYDSIEPYLEGWKVKKRERNSFKTPLDVRVVDGGKRFMLLHQFTYRWKYRGLTVVISVPVGFVTDFASIPRIFRIIIPKLGRWNKAAVLHDFIYQIGHSITRKMADRCFLGAMRDLGVAKWQRNLMYWAVRVGGWMAWRKR